jgi:hypothetical protein
MKSESSWGARVPSLIVECEWRSTLNVFYLLYELAAFYLKRDRGTFALVDRHKDERRGADDVELRSL